MNRGQLRHPFLQVNVSDAAWAETIWEVHLKSLGDLLQLVALEQQRRYPALTYPVRFFPGGKNDAILVVVDGWFGEPTGLLANTTALVIQPDATPSGG